MPGSARLVARLRAAITIGLFLIGATLNSAVERDQHAPHLPQLFPQASCFISIEDLQRAPALELTVGLLS